MKKAVPFQIIRFLNIKKQTGYLLIISLFIISCGVSIPLQTSVQKKIISHNQDGNKAFYNNDYEGALNEFNSALQLALSVDNFDSAAISQINIAMVYRKEKDLTKANQSIDPIITSKNKTYSKKSIYSAMLLKIMLLMDASDYSKAEKMASSALSLCDDIACKSAGTIYNLLSRIAIYNKNAKEAQDNAAIGQKLNTKNEDKVETANSYRLLGDAFTLNNDFTKAVESYEQALTVDKSLDIPEKIFIDLMSLGHGYLNQSKYKDALEYFKRAHSVSINGELKKEIADSALMVDKCEAIIKNAK